MMFLLMVLIFGQNETTWQEAMIAFQKANPQGFQTLDLGKGDFSFSAWIKTKKGGTIISKAPKEGEWITQGKTLFVRDQRLCFDIGWVGEVVSNKEVANNQWRKIGLVCEGDEVRLYIDGELDVTGHLERKPDPIGTVFKVGFTSDNFPEPSGFRGRIDEMELNNHLFSFENAKGFQAKNCSFKRGKKGKALTLDGHGYLLMESKGDQLWSQLERRFSDPESLKQMAWEREDGIWDKPGVQDLCKRYVKACFRSKKLTQQAIVARDDLKRVRKLYYQSRAYGQVMALLEDHNPENIKQAIQHLQNVYPKQYDPAFLKRITGLEKRIHGEDIDSLKEELSQLQQEALVAHNPLMKEMDQLLFVKRKTYQSSHYYTDYIDGCLLYGGNLCILSLKDNTVKELVPELEGGIFGRYDLSFDAKRVVFDYKASKKEGFRIYEIGIDGKGLKRLTFPPPDEKARIKKYDNSHLGGTGRVYYHQTDDMHPCYLPDGGICFISTRCERGILCDGPDILTTTSLYRMDGDGKNMVLLSHSPVSEEAPTVMNDGRILYTRWEYVDKGGSAVKCLWAMRPDGSGSVEIFGNDHAFPSFYNGRAIPDHNNLFVTIGGPHMPLGVGTVIRLDINHPIRTRAPMTYLTPKIDIQEEWGYKHKINNQWESVDKGPLFDDPYPLSDKFFLVSFNKDQHVHHPNAYGIYLLDEWDNRTLIHQDPEMSCWQPMPLLPRKKPPVIPPVTEKNNRTIMAMSDVYQGLDGVKPGAVKYLRVMETQARPWSARRFWDGDEHGQQHSVVSLWTHTHVKILHGVVPVAKDGSALFYAPADKNLYFQALDENYMEVQRMRTFVNLNKGEPRSCIGCHEMRHQAPPVKRAAALMQAPLELIPQPGDSGPRPIDYVLDVQPTWDRHCIKCHAGARPEGDFDLSGELTRLFNVSYENIIKRQLVKTVSEIGQKMGAVEDTPPYTWGAHKSPLISHLLKGHQDIKLTKEEFIRLITWVDANAPYYGTYFGRKNLRYKNHPDFRPLTR